MENYITPKIRENYKNQPLIIPTYASAKKNYFVEDLERFDKLQYCLGEVNDHEADITETGIFFFKEVFGLKKLAEMLHKHQWYPNEYQSEQDIYNWLKWWESQVRK